ncbi:hypothetical protein ABIF07_002735 [Bradyrhizobium elkanii]
MTSPDLFEPVLGRHFGFGDARRDRDRVPVPMCADVGGQDRPRHVGEAAGEERRGELDDAMLRLEPGDVMRRPLAADLAEAQMRVHPVDIDIDRARHRVDLGDIGIIGRTEQIVMAAQPPQQAIEQGKAFVTAMQDRGLGELDEFGRHIEPRLRRIRQFIHAGCRR